MKKLIVGILLLLMTTTVVADYYDCYVPGSFTERMMYCDIPRCEGSSSGGSGMSYYHYAKMWNMTTEEVAQGELMQLYLDVQKIKAIIAFNSWHCKNNICWRFI